LLAQPERQSDTLQDIADANIIAEWKQWAIDGESDKLFKSIGKDATRLTKLLKSHLIKVANRVLPKPEHRLRWKETDGWCALEEIEDKSRANLDCGGQRGISLKRIQQLLDLRQLCQSLNKLMRREYGKSIRLERGAEIPESCQQVLDAYEKLREQRVNHIANGLFALALGVRRMARTPAALARRLGIKLADPLHPTREEMKLIELRCREHDLHGIYEPIPGRRPVDFIVLEDLAGFRTSSVRSRRDNRNLARWCHRQIVKKLEELREPLGIPILKVPAKDTSRFCSRTGLPGFRAIEVRLEDKQLPRWQQMLEDEKHRAFAGELFEQLKMANSEITERKREKTLVAPLFLGPLFIALTNNQRLTDPQPTAVQNADMGAAITIGLRALGHPDEWRIRPERWVPSGSQVVKKSKRKKPVSEKAQKAFGKYYYADFSGRLGGIEQGGIAFPKLVEAKKFWDLVEAESWTRCREINEARMRQWGIRGRGQPIAAVRERSR
jgi:hypothetical protein